MTQIDPEAALVVQPELTSSERILWAGRPVLGTILHREDLFLIPFSLIWGGFAIFWEAGVAGFWGHGRSSGPSIFGMIWGIPFVLVGQYAIWGRFLVVQWKKRRTHYAVTNQRVIVVQTGPSRKTAAAYIDRLPMLIKESGNGASGTLRFGESEPAWSTRRGWSMWDIMAIGAVPVFVDVEDVNGLYLLVSELGAKTAAHR
jgi:hypothetical protein